MPKINENIQKLLESRYFYRDKLTGDIQEKTASDMFRRVSNWVARAEKDNKTYSDIFFDLMNNQYFMPNSPTLIGAGYDKKCLSACSVLPPVPDSLDGIYHHMWMNANLTKHGCGVGQDLSNIRPKEEIIKTSGGKSAGVINWLQLLNAVANTTIQGDKARRAANMVTLRFNHPDIKDWIHAKDIDGELNAMNMSVTITDEEVLAIKENKDIDLIWNNKIYQTINARTLFDELLYCMWNRAEPGIIFLDAMNKDNPFNLQDGNFNSANAHYYHTTNPCGEQVLESYEFCTLGSINVENLYNEQLKDIDWELFKFVIQNAIRLLDDIIDVNVFVFPEFEAKVKANRKIGLGICGFANLLIKLNIPYDSQKCLEFIDTLAGFKHKIESEYNQILALEKGNFPDWNESIYGKKNIPARCATISTQAPTGSISGILGTMSYGIEPLFGVVYTRNIVDNKVIEINDVFVNMLNSIFDDKDKVEKILQECKDKGTVQITSVPKKLRDIFKCANDISTTSHIDVQAQFQKYYHNAISKTINMPNNAKYEDLYNLMIYAWEKKLKGITIYRDNCRINQTIQLKTATKEKPIYNSIKPISRKQLGKLVGTTDHKKVACGDLYITVNKDKDGCVVETFVNTSKNGICKSNVDGLNRMVSVALRSGVKVEEIIDQLKGIKCPACTRIVSKGEKLSGHSCADCIAQCLEDEYNGSVTVELSTKQCPDCNNQLRSESGCCVCSNCGFSKCE